MLQDIVDCLRQACSLAVLTGAGVSAESGVPTFRDALTGLWTRFNPEELAMPEAFARDLGLVKRWYDERRARIPDMARQGEDLRAVVSFHGSLGTSSPAQNGERQGEAAGAGRHGG